MNAEARAWIERLELRRHPEGGWYRETYRAAGMIPRAALPAGFAGDRAYSTAVYFLLARPEVSVLHRLRADELWHFHAGGALTVVTIDPAGALTSARVGADHARGDRFQTMVPAGSWFGAELVPEAEYALVGCTVAPGFDFADFEIGRRAELVAAYPRHGAAIERLTR
jgi:predicted cupin superfamily sugar epimerase